MQIAGRSVAITGIAAVVICLGCGPRAAQKPIAGPTPPKAEVPLPEWAPKNPSPEFLRAARVLKPLPEELLRGAARGDAAAKARMEAYRRTFPAAYEFFGTFSDEQVQRFLSTKQLTVPVKSLRKSQRAALDNWFDTFRKANQGTAPVEMRELGDYLIILYKQGAKRDLSNVDVGFNAKTMGAGHIVHIYFRVIGPDGSVNDLGSAFAQI